MHYTCVDILLPNLGLYNINLFYLRITVQIHFIALEDRGQCTFTSIAI